MDSLCESNETGHMFVLLITLIWNMEQSWEGEEGVVVVNYPLVSTILED